MNRTVHDPARIGKNCPGSCHGLLECWT